ncbi:AAA family ATPase [Candidatus Omnitrophota bacterium]
MQKKFITFIKINLVKIIVLIVLTSVVICALFFITYCVKNYLGLEPFSRKQISGQMGLLLPMFIIVHLFTLPLMMGMQYYMMQGGGLGKIGKDRLSKAKVNVKWSEVIGMEHAKQEAWELVKLLKDRSLLKAIGGKIIKGTMMMGPPGCGKTYLAKAIATECNMPMLSAVGSDFVGMFVGQGAAQMKTLFKQARALGELEGGCIIFIDEIDSFARPRQQLSGFGGSISHNATINQLLTEMDGLRKAENNIVVIAATNVSEGELDSAVMRAGRFERKIHVTRPNLKEREEIFKFYLTKVKAEENISADILARKTLWFSPSEIEGMIRESGLIALREKREIINFKDLSTAYDRVVFGAKSNLQLSDKEKEWVAYHEAGHAIIGYLLHPTDDIIKATIIPHKGSLGFVAPRAKEETHIRSKEWYLASIKVSVASYAAERIKYGTTGSGVSADFKSAMNHAYNMVWSWGMGKTGLIGDMEQLISAGGASFISNKTKETLDDDVQDILRTCLEDVSHILNDKRELLDHFAQELYHKGELEFDEIEDIFKKFNLKPATRSTEPA